jgi:hypothetical protein
MKGYLSSSMGVVNSVGSRTTAGDGDINAPGFQAGTGISIISLI